MTTSKLLTVPLSTILGLFFLLVAPVTSTIIRGRNAALADEEYHHHYRLLMTRKMESSNSHKRVKKMMRSSDSHKSRTKLTKTKEETLDDDDHDIMPIEAPAHCQGDTKPAPEKEPLLKPPTDIECLIAFMAFDIDVFDLSRYDEWFNDDSVLELAETGSYVGAANIGEYVAFTASFYFDYYANLEPAQQIFYAKWNEEDQTCHAMAASVNVVDFNTELTGLVDTGFETMVGMKFEFEFGGFMNRVLVYFTNPFLDYLFGNALETPAVGRKVCGIMESNCADVFYNLNGFTSIDDCMKAYESLPSIEPDFPGYVDGKTRGCRKLHAAFAETNDAHCPHLSIVPQYDEQCVVKCQVSRHTPLSELWTEEELVLLENYAESKGFGADGFNIIYGRQAPV